MHQIKDQNFSTCSSNNIDMPTVLELQDVNDFSQRTPSEINFEPETKNRSPIFGYFMH